MKSIKRTNSACLVAIVFCFAVMSMSYPSAADDYTDLMKLIADSEDVRIDAQDLAFLLVTHGFNAEPNSISVDSLKVINYDPVWAGQNRNRLIEQFNKVVAAASNLK